MAFDVKTAGLMSHPMGHQSRVFGDHRADSHNRHVVYKLQSKQLVGVPDLILILLCGRGSGTLIMHSFLC